MGKTEQNEGTVGQLSLIEAESDEALLIPRHEMEKRYTARTVAKVELKRNYILDLLAFGLPIETIAEKTHASTRIVQRLGALYSQQVAADAMKFAQVLKAKAAKFLFLAEQKAEGAKFGELMVGVGIAMQRAQEAELGASSLLPDTAIDVGEESEGLRAARKFLEDRGLLGPGPAILNAELHTGPLPHIEPTERKEIEAKLWARIEKLNADQEPPHPDPLPQGGEGNNAGGCA